jgi:CRISPR-associated Csx14 family protein
MSALMALLVPLFPCVKGLYHVIDPDEGTRRQHFKSIEEILDLPKNVRLSFFLLSDDQLKQLKLVEIPCGEQQQVSEEFRSLLFTITEEKLDELWNKDPVEAESVETFRYITQKTTFTPTLTIKLTARVKKEYERMLHDNVPQALRFARCFELMKDPYHLFEAMKDSGLTRDSHSFHFFKRRRTDERPFYHTEPENIELFNMNQPSKGAKVDTVIISGLAVEQNDDSYKPTAHELLQAFDKEESTLPLESVLPTGSPAQPPPEKESVLIVPLGDSPMIATQLYTLLTYQGSNIREVVLVFPAKVKPGADLLVKAFKDEGKGVECIPKKIPGFDDIDSTKACEAFEKTLDEAIDEACKRHPGCQIEMTLSGGRKGMAALAMFVAQRKGIRYLYHTLIPDNRVLDQVEDETTVDALRPTMVSKELRNNRLFLRAYEGEGPFTKFVLFKVPVLPAGRA